MEALLQEVDKAVADKHRVTADIENATVKEIIQNGTEYALRYGIPTSDIVGIGAGGLAAGAGVGAAVAAGAGVGGAVAGGAAAGGGLVAKGVVAGAAAGAGAAGGTGLLILGAIFGVGVVVGGGIVAGVVWWRHRNSLKKQVLNEKITAKQNGVIKLLADEVEQLRSLLASKDRQIDELTERLEYLLGVLAGFEGVKAIVCP